MFPVARFVTDVRVTLLFFFHSVCAVRSSYFNIFSASVLIAVVSHEVAMSIYISVPFSLSRVVMSGLVLGVLYYYYYYYYSICNPCGLWSAQLSLSILSRKVFTECRCQRHVKPPTWRTSD